MGSFGVSGFFNGAAGFFVITCLRRLTGCDLMASLVLRLSGFEGVIGKDFFCLTIIAESGCCAVRCEVIYALSTL